MEGKQLKLSHIIIFAYTIIQVKMEYIIMGGGSNTAQWLITIKEMLRKYASYDVWQSQNAMWLDALGQFKKEMQTED